MKINCPICHNQIHEVKKEEDFRTAECINQCIRLKYDSNEDKITGYGIRVNLEGKDYHFVSSIIDIKGNDLKYSHLKVYGKNNDGYSYSTIVKLDRFFEPEEVFPDPKRTVARLLNLKAFT